MGNSQNAHQNLDKDERTQEDHENKAVTAAVKAAFWYATASELLMDGISFKKLWPLNASFSTAVYEQMVRLCLESDHHHGMGHSVGGQVNGVFCGNDEGLNCRKYVQESEKILHLLSSSSQLQFYFSVFSGGRDSLSRQDGEVMIKTCHEMSWAHMNISVPIVHQNDCTSYTAVHHGLFGQTGEQSFEELARWICHHCSRMFQPLHHLTCQALCGKQQVKLQATAIPTVFKLRENGECMMDAFTLWLLTVTLPQVYLPTTAGGMVEAGHEIHNPLAEVIAETGWHVLYSSNTQGLSPNRFQHHVFGYKGPTVMLLWFEQHVYCAAFDEEWRESSRKWGGMDCVLYSLKPHFKYIQGGADMVYFNIHDRSLPKGLKLGKDSRTTTLEVNSDFTQVKHYGIDYTLDVIEVWGCGGSQKLEEQIKQKTWELKDVEKHKQRKLKLEDWKDNPDKEILNIGGVTTEHAQK